MTAATPLARYSAMWKSALRERLRYRPELHHHRGHDRICPHSRPRGRCEGGFWRPFNPKDIGRFLLAAERFQRAGRQKGERSGPLGAVALEVLRELAPLIDYRTGRLEPALDVVLGGGFGLICWTIDEATAKPYLVDDGKFQWDDAKAAANVVAHGVTFEASRKVFKDPFALDWRDESEDYGEDRYAILGMSEGRLLFVAFTMRGDAIRIVSARLTEPHERRRYHEENDA